MSNKFLQLAAQTSSGIFIVLIVVLARLAGLLEPLELLYFDLLLKARLPEPQDSRIVLIEIDSVDLLESKNSKISPQELISLIDQVLAYEPAVLGFNVLRDLIDDTDPAFKELSNVVSQNGNIISAESFIPPFIDPLPNTIPDQVGFVDLFPDHDHSIRRMLLGSPDFQDSERFKFSFSLLLAKHYLKKHGYVLANGKSDPAAMRFGDIEISQLHSNTGGYSQIDAAGVQAVVNYRNAPDPFKTVLFKNLSIRLKPSLIKDKIVVIGVTDGSKRAHAITPVDKRMDGLQLTAHFTSQITSAVLDDRPSIQSLHEIYEYMFIVFSGIPIVWLWSKRTSISLLILSEAILLFILFAFSYWLLIFYGYWLVVVPSMLVSCLNLITYFSSVYRDEMRRKVIGRTFDILHNGPLQSLAIILNDLRSKQIQNNDLENRLRALSQEIRQIGDALQGESLSYEQSLLLKNSAGNALDLNDDLHKLFYQIYTATLRRDFQNFRDIKMRIRSFEAVSISKNKFSLKRDICRYLEEAICNVGRHAVKPTRLIVTGKNYNGSYILTVEDDGLSKINSHSNCGQGTKSARRLAKKIKGEFKRDHLSPKGTVCQLKWQL